MDVPSIRTRGPSDVVESDDGLVMGVRLLLLRSVPSAVESVTLMPDVRKMVSSPSKPSGIVRGVMLGPDNAAAAESAGTAEVARTNACVMSSGSVISYCEVVRYASIGAVERSVVELPSVVSFKLIFAIWTLYGLGSRTFGAGGERS